MECVQYPHCIAFKVKTINKTEDQIGIISAPHSLLLNIPYLQQIKGWVAGGVDSVFTVLQSYNTVDQRRELTDRA